MKWSIEPYRSTMDNPDKECARLRLNGEPLPKRSLVGYFVNHPCVFRTLLVDLRAAGEEDPLAVLLALFPHKREAIEAAALEKCIEVLEGS